MFHEEQTEKSPHYHKIIARLHAERMRTLKKCRNEGSTDVYVNERTASQNCKVVNFYLSPTLCLYQLIIIDLQEVLINCLNLMNAQTKQSEREEKKETQK